jgi:oxalate decarboxylase
MDLKPGALREMHWHPHADEWQFYVKGRSRVTIFGSHGRVKMEEFEPGHVAFIKTGPRELYRAGGRRTHAASDSV